jgi:hypothetical protein
MTQPANKRFIMEDKYNTDLALKAPIANPTFTGTVTTGSGGITVPSGNITVTSGNVTASAGTVSGSTISGTTVSGTTVSATTTVTAGTGITATTGNITATAGNLVASNGYVQAGISVEAVTGSVQATAGPVNAGTSMTAGTRILSNSTTSITNTSNTHALQAGPQAGLNVRLGTDGTNAGVQAVNNGAYSTLGINSLGGNVSVGSASTTTSVLGTFTPPRGYLLVDRLEYTSSPAAFTKATYPWLRAIRIVCVGGGGGGGGAALTAAAQNAIGQAGAGGAYAETFITEAAIAALAASVTLAVGAGGPAGGAGGAGTVGGDTSFGTTCVAKGGAAGAAGAATAVGSFAAGVSSVGVTGSVGDIIYPGGASGIRHYMYNASVYRPLPGGSAVSAIPVTAQTIVTTTLAGAAPGTGNYGVGGFPGVNAQSQATAIAGGIGAGGFMIVELYA